MSQKLETFFGFKVHLTDQLDPAHIEVLSERAHGLLALANYNSKEYHVYFHAFQVVPKDRHFGIAGGIAARCSEIWLNFAVNPKQRRNGKIRFLNYLSPSEKIEHVTEALTTDNINYRINATYFATRYDFRNELITFVKERVSPNHRKIKVSIQAIPTESFRKTIQRERALTPTELDFHFGSYATLLPPPKEVVAGRTIDNEGRLVFVARSAVISAIAGSLQLIEQILNVLRGPRKEYQVTVELIDDTIEIRRDGYIQEQIAASRIHMSAWNEVRHEALFARVCVNWKQYNDLDGGLPLESTDEKSRITAKMLLLKKHLCDDISEMMGLYEQTLRIKLMAHFSLQGPF